MLDFISSLYLGFRHGSASLRPWSQLTTGKPAALAELPEALDVARELAQLQGCQRATLGTSTLHLAWDLFGMLANGPISIYMDADAYPILRWGIERAAAQGVPVRSFPHRDVDALRRLFRRGVGRRRPVVVSDGMGAVCGRPVPVAAYLECVRGADGLLVLDDTQALGILGSVPSPAAPYGWGGGGSLQHNDISGPDIVLISSLAKGFGAPLAILSGSHAMVERFLARSETRVHCSPPSAAAIHSAACALRWNRQCGDVLRQRLAGLVLHFNRCLANAGLRTTGGLFPAQTVETPMSCIQLHQWLLGRGIQTVLRRGSNGCQPRLGFMITARHQQADIDRAVGAIAMAINMMSHQWLRNNPG